VRRESRLSLSELAISAQIGKSSPRTIYQEESRYLFLYLFRQMVASEITLRTSESNINIYGPYNFSQSLTEQIMIPTSTPPTIDKKGKIIYISYKVRVTVNLNSKHSAKRQNIVTVELPIVVGTWPRAAVPIDEDDDWIDGVDSMMLSDEDMAADNDSLYDYSTNDQNFVPDIQQNTSSSSANLMLHNQSGLRTNSDWRLSTSSTSSSTSSANAAARSNLATTFPNNHSTDGVIRSDSNASRISVKSAASISSQKSSRSLESGQDRLTRNTSVSTTASAPEQPTAGGRYVRTTPVQVPPAPPPPPPFTQPALVKTQTSYIPRSASATDLNRPPNVVPVPLPFVQQPSYDDAALYRHRGMPPTNDTMHDPRFRGGRPPSDPKRYHSTSDSNYSGIPMNGNNRSMPHPSATNMYDHGPAPSNYLTASNNYAGQHGRHMRTPSDSSHMYHTQPNYPAAAKFTPMPAVPDTQHSMQPFMQDDAVRTNHHSYQNTPQFTPPRQFDSYHGLPHRHSDPQTQPSTVINTQPVMRSDSDPAAYFNRENNSVHETPSLAAPQVEEPVVEHHGFYDSSDSSSEFGDAAGSASDDSDDSDDEGDLLRIVEKKRRQEQKRMRRRQRRVFTIAE
jgi:hypothetical protein